MTTTGPGRADTAPAAPTERAAHPVRRFLIVVIGLALIAVLLWWSALLNPRVSFTANGGGFDIRGFTGYVEARLVNEAPSSLTIVDVVLQSPGAHATTVASNDGLEVIGRRLDPGEGVDLTLDYRSDGCVPEGAVSAALVILTVRTSVGVDRTVRFPAGDMMRATACGL